jgi:hypothetical protein
VRQTRVFPAFVLALSAALLVACSDEKPAAAPAAAPAPAPAEAPPTGLRGSGLGGGAGSTNAAGHEKQDRTKAEAPKELELKVLLKSRVVARGAPVMVIVQLKNISKDPVKLVAARGDLGRRTRFVVQRAGQETPVGCGLPVTTGSAPREKDVNLAPNETLATEVDLLTCLEDTTSYLDGRVRFTAQYQGDASAAKDGSRGWNTDVTHKIESKQCDLELKLPDWLEEIGATEDTYGEMRNLAMVFAPGAPDADKRVAEVVQKGAPAMASLLFLTRSMGGVDDREAETGRRALMLLRSIGEPALAAIASAKPGDDPSVLMTIGVLLEDHEERSGLPPSREVTKALREVAGADGNATMFEVHMRGGAATEPIDYLLDDHGILTVTRGMGDKATRLSRRLPTDQLATLKRALLTSRIAVWKHIQRSDADSEGSVTFSLLKGADTVSRITLSEREAMKTNPLPVGVVEAFQKVAAEFKDAKTP